MITGFDEVGMDTVDMALEGLGDLAAGGWLSCKDAEGDELERSGWRLLFHKEFMDTVYTQWTTRFFPGNPLKDNAKDAEAYEERVLVHPTMPNIIAGVFCGKEVGPLTPALQKFGITKATWPAWMNTGNSGWVLVFDMATGKVKGPWTGNQKLIEPLVSLVLDPGWWSDAPSLPAYTGAPVSIPVANAPTSSTPSWLTAVGGAAAGALPGVVKTGAGLIPGMSPSTTPNMPFPSAYPGQTGYGQQYPGQTGYGQQQYGQQGMCPPGSTLNPQTMQCAPTSSNMWLYLGGAAVVAAAGLLWYLKKKKAAAPVAGFSGLGRYRRRRQGLGYMSFQLAGMRRGRRLGR